MKHKAPLVFVLSIIIVIVLGDFVAVNYLPNATISSTYSNGSDGEYLVVQPDHSTTTYIVGPLSCLSFHSGERVHLDVAGDGHATITESC